MSPHVRIDRSPLGELVAAKTAWPPEHEDRLVREAAVLVAARHPGVVALDRLSVRAGALELRTRWVGPRSLDETAPLPAAQAAAVLGAVAATVADLHRLGIAHGCLRPAHVLLDRRGRPVLCSFGRAGLSLGPEADGARADDVAALGDLLATAVGDPDDPEIVPLRRVGRRRSNHLHRHLLTLADHARADDPAARPTAAGLAGALAELAPDARFPGPADGASRDEQRDRDRTLDDALDRLRASATTVPRRRRRWPFPMAVLGLVTSISGGAALATARPSEPRSFEPIEPIEPVGSGPRVSTTAPPASARTTIVSGPAASTPVVEVDGQRYAVGRDGDVALAAPWRCDGRSRALVLRPGSGELFVFDDVPAPGADATARPFAREPGGVELLAPDPADPCPPAVVLHDDGSLTRVTVP